MSGSTYAGWVKRRGKEYMQMAARGRTCLNLRPERSELFDVAFGPTERLVDDVLDLGQG
jgi:hypothetical protein